MSNKAQRFARLMRAFGLESASEGETLIYRTDHWSTEQPAGGGLQHYAVTAADWLAEVDGPGNNAGWLVPVELAENDVIVRLIAYVEEPFTYDGLEPGADVQLELALGDIGGGWSAPVSYTVSNGGGLPSYAQEVSDVLNAGSALWLTNGRGEGGGTWRPARLVLVAIAPDPVAPPVAGLAHVWVELAHQS